MLLSFFTEEAYDELLNNTANNSEKYLQEDEWLDEFFGNRHYFKQSTVDVLPFTPAYDSAVKTDDQKSQEDLINTRKIYDAFKNLTPIQASNKYMWTYLCHAVPEYRKYILNRWTDLRENTIKTRYFVTSTKDSLFNNSLSRLWWYAHLTYDSANRNPYALTQTLLTNQTICTDFIDTYNCRNANRSKGVLTAIKEFIDILGTTKGVSNYFRECNKYLNRYAAVTNMDFLAPEEIKKITLDYLLELADI